jgi:transglutaminase-like putative cysteine protease
MAEPQPQTIQQRIAALNQSHVGRLPSSSPARPYASRAKSVNNPPQELNGSVIDSKEIGNKPASTRQNGILPPPTRSVSAQNTPTRNGSRPPPPLPVRKNSGQPAPTLPPRRPSAQLDRRTSSESIRSNASFCTTSTSGTTESKNRLIAPAWRETDVPPLPSLPQRPKSEAEKAKRVLRAPLKPPPLPSRISSAESSRGRDQTANPSLPGRTPSADARNLPQGFGVGSETVKQAPRKIPPAPSADLLEKARQSSFASLSKHIEEVEEVEVEPDVPPAVPQASRPDLSAIQATKPKFKADSSGPVSNNAAASTVCMICRDFSAPDNYAAQFPRESLPSNDLGWLATQLTAPFPSLTDKARALFTWLHYNIKYDVDSFFNNCVQPSTPSKTLATGLAVCEGYAGLFATLATKAGLEAFVVGGHGKGFGHSQLAPGSRVPPFEGNHAWNVVKIDGGKWKLIDSCWGAGAVQGHGQPYIQRLDATNFTKPNDEFLLSHYPERKDQFYTDNGGPGMTWEAYVLQDHTVPFGIEQPTIFLTAHEEGFGDRSFRPACKKISIHQPGPIRFQFNFKCEHWTLTKHSKKTAPFLFLLDTHGIDGRKDEKIPFTYVRGTGPNGGGDCWFVDIADPRVLGAPGQKVAIANITSFGSREDTRGLSLQDYQAQVGRIGMGWSYIAQWELTA